jgi:hypothetical protein
VRNFTEIPGARLPLPRTTITDPAFFKPCTETPAPHMVFLRSLKT